MTTGELTDRLRRCSVKVFTTSKSPNYYQPWQFGTQQLSYGSGCILEGNRILTCAHVVSKAVFVQVARPDDPNKYTAHVLHIDHERELAVLVVDDPRFFAEASFARLGTLPTQNEPISIFGFPQGGNDISITAGVISRIEVRRYSHSHRGLLAMQTDAAINPGNSGGPAFKESGELAGLAFQSSRKSNRTAYIVPTSIIRAFLDDIANDRVEGVPDLGIVWQKIESPALRRYLKLAEGSSGVLVARVFPGSSADGVLQAGDVIIAIDGVAISNDGSAVTERIRLHFTHLVSRRQVHDTIEVDLVRDGTTRRLVVTLRALVSLIAPPQPLAAPSYLIFGGLVLLPLSFDYMACWDWPELDPRFKDYYANRLPSEHRRQIVLVSEVLAHDINVGYHHVRLAIVDKINKREIRSFADVLTAIAAPIDGFQIVELETSDVRNVESNTATMIVLDAAEIERANAEILDHHHIPHDRSIA